VSSLHLELPRDVLEQLVHQVAERIRAELTATSPWMTRAEAAEYLRIPISRLEKDRTVPSHHWDARVFYSRPELDEWMAAQ
jgi:hypothetical protein